MTEVSSGDLSPMALKCTAFCQALTSQGIKFSFKLTTATGYYFSLGTKKSVKLVSAVAEQAKRRGKVESF